MFAYKTLILETGALINAYSEEDYGLKRGDFILLSAQEDSDQKNLGQIHSSPLWSEPEQKTPLILERVEDEALKTEGWGFAVPLRIDYLAERGWTRVDSSALPSGTQVVVKTEHGNEIASTLEPPLAIRPDQTKLGLLPFIRLASSEDLDRSNKNAEQSSEALAICQEKIEKHKLPMNLVKTHILLEGNKILFFFTSEGRVDFRSLVKDLASVFHMRVELRQIGIRDRSQMLGGCGTCGQPLCCHRCKGMIQPVSIKMAKEQNLALNSNKISGVCGKLLCCLAYEYETYHELNKLYPKLGSKVWIGENKGVVKDVNIQTGSVKIMTEDHQYHEVNGLAIQTNQDTGRKYVETRKQSD